MKTTVLQFPFKGQSKNFAATTQPQFTSPRMNNVRVRDVLEYRARGGQRPGFAKAYNQHIGYNVAANRPIVAICQVTTVTIGSPSSGAYGDGTYGDGTYGS